MKRTDWWAGVVVIVATIIGAAITIKPESAVEQYRTTHNLDYAIYGRGKAMPPINLSEFDEFIDNNVAEQMQPRKVVPASDAPAEPPPLPRRMPPN